MKATVDEMKLAKKYLPPPENFKRGERCWVYLKGWLYQFKLRTYRDDNWNRMLTREWACITIMKRHAYYEKFPTIGTSFTNIPFDTTSQ